MSAGDVRGGLERDPRRGTPREGRGSLEDALAPLAAEFRRWEFGLVSLHRGPSLTAQRRDGGPGLCLVITPDPGEMRRALNEDSPPGRQGRGPGGNRPGGD